MGFPNSITSYPDIEGLFDKALDSAKGLRLTFTDEKQARFNVGRMNAYRIRLKRENARVFPADHPLHNRTPYDGLMIQHRGKEVIVEKLTPERFNIEDLT